MGLVGKLTHVLPLRVKPRRRSPQPSHASIQAACRSSGKHLHALRANPASARGFTQGRPEGYTSPGRGY